MKRLLLILTALFFIGQVQPSGPTDVLTHIGLDMAIEKCLKRAEQTFPKFKNYRHNLIHNAPNSTEFTYMAAAYGIYLVYNFDKINTQYANSNEEKQSAKIKRAFAPVAFGGAAYGMVKTLQYLTKNHPSLSAAKLGMLSSLIWMLSY